MGGSRLPLTEKEWDAVQEQLKVEQLLIAKFKEYAMLCEDPELKLKCETMAGKHQSHYQMLLRLLR